MQHIISFKPADAFDPNRLKCVVNNRGYAIYFSQGLKVLENGYKIKVLSGFFTNVQFY